MFCKKALEKITFTFSKLLFYSFFNILQNFYYK